MSTIVVFHPASAHQGATGIVKERMDAMSTLGDHAEIVGDMLKGQRAMDPQAIERAAAAFVEHGERIPILFPDTAESRNGSATEALPAIWERWERFESLATQFTESSRALAQAASSDGENAPTVRAAFFTSVKHCRSCHEQFRLEQD